MITWLSNVITGRFQHWNEANNTYISVLYARTKQFPPAIEPLLFHFIVGSLVLVEWLVGPDKGRKRIIKKDANTISAQQFQSLHNLNIWTFMALFGHQNPEFHDSFFAACEDFIGIHENEALLLKLILQMKQIDAVELYSAQFAEVSKILDYRNDMDPRELYAFSCLAATAYSDAIQGHKEALAKLK